MEMDFLRRSARCPRLEKKEKKVNIKNSVLDYIRYKQLNWYYYVQRMDHERLPKRILEWCPPGRRRKGRPRKSWRQEVTTGMRKRRIGDREGWRKKINLP